MSDINVRKLQLICKDHSIEQLLTKQRKGNDDQNKNTVEQGIINFEDDVLSSSSSGGSLGNGEDEDLVGEDSCPDDDDDFDDFTKDRKLSAVGLKDDQKDPETNAPLKSKYSQ